MERLKVFVRSTIDDLKSERSLVQTLLSELRFDSFLSEYQSAQMMPPEEVCLSQVNESDIFVLIIGERYGFIPTPQTNLSAGSPYDGKISVTHGEFLKARELHKPILVFVKNINREQAEDDFLKSLGDFLYGQYYTMFNSVEELREKLLEGVHTLLANLVRHNYITPWRRKPNVTVVETPDQVSQVGARILGRAIQSHPNVNIGLSAGKTVGRIYSKFFQEFDSHQMQNIKHTSFFSVTEHFGISQNNPHSYYHWFHLAFFNKILDQWGILVSEEHKKLTPSSIERDTVDGFRIWYDYILENNRVAIQLISPAPNGQIISIDPGAYPLDEMSAMGTSLVRYSKETSRYLVPVSPHDIDIVIGIRNLLGRSERLIIPVHGADKRDVVRRMILGPIGDDCPASLVSRCPKENKLLFIIDIESSQGLPREIGRYVNLVKPNEVEEFLWG